MGIHAGILLLAAAFTGTAALAQEKAEQDIEKQERALQNQHKALEKQAQALEKQNKAQAEALEKQNKAQAEALEKQHDDNELEARLEAARERLNEAAREVSELTAELSLPSLSKAFSWEGAPRAIIGVQVDGKRSALVEKVSPGGPAAEAGIRAGDVIVALNGNKIEGEDASREVVRQMRKVEPNSKVKVRVLRDGKSRDFEVTARPVDSALGMPVPPKPPEPPFMSFVGSLHRELMDMELATLTPALGEYFGADKGVLVLRAPASDNYRLKDGDVILSIDGREPKNGSHATRILRSYQPGEKITLKIMRQRKPMSLEVTSPESLFSRSRAQWHPREDEEPEDDENPL